MKMKAIMSASVLAAGVMLLYGKGHPESVSLTVINNSDKKITLNLQYGSKNNWSVTIDAHARGTLSGVDRPKIISATVRDENKQMLSSASPQSTFVKNSSTYTTITIGSDYSISGN